MVEHPPAQAAYQAHFAYTVGLTETFGHPEIVLLGTWQHAHPFLNAVGDLVRDGRRFETGDTSEEVLDGFVVRFDPVSERCQTDAAQPGRTGPSDAGRSKRSSSSCPIRPAARPRTRATTASRSPRLAG